jgi:hypothetical protein
LLDTGLGFFTASQETIHPKDRANQDYQPQSAKFSFAVLLNTPQSVMPNM